MVPSKSLFGNGTVDHTVVFEPFASPDSAQDADASPTNSPNRDVVIFTGPTTPNCHRTDISASTIPEDLMVEFESGRKEKIGVHADREKESQVQVQPPISTDSTTSDEMEGADLDSLFEEMMDAVQLPTPKSSPLLPHTQAIENAIDPDDALLATPEEEAQIPVSEPEPEPVQVEDADAGLFFSDPDDDFEQDDWGAGDTDRRDLSQWYQNMDLEDTAERYDLRPGPRAEDVPHATHVDQDETGDFDPRARRSPEKIAAKYPERKKRSPAETREATEPQEARPREPGTLQHERRKGTWRVITLSHESARWAAKLSAIKDDDRAFENGRSRGADHWREESNESTPNFTELNPNQILDQRLRNRDALANKNVPAEDQELLLPELGNPQARGCLCCWELKNSGDPEWEKEQKQCSLIKGSRWPCNHCEDNDYECQLIIEPEYKTSCENCGRSSCSFRNNRTQRGPCDECQERGEICVYGPASGYTRLNPEVGEDPEVFREKRKQIEQHKEVQEKQAQTVKEREEKKEAEKRKAAAKNAKIKTSQRDNRCVQCAEANDNCSYQKRLVKVRCEGCTQKDIKCFRQLPSTDVSPNETPNSTPGPVEVDDNPRPAKKPRVDESGTNARKPKGKKAKAQTKAKKARKIQLPRGNPQLPYRKGYMRVSRPITQHQHAGMDINLWVQAPATIKLQVWSTGDSDDDVDDSEREQWRLSRPGDKYPLTPPATPPREPTTQTFKPGSYFMSGALPSPPIKIGGPHEVDTRMYHPVDINIENRFECTWCQDLPTAIIGYPERRVRVQETEDGYMELDPEEQDIVSSKMCLDCTNERLMVNSCGEHRLDQIPGAIKISAEDMIERIMENSDLTYVNICSICTKGALFQCTQYGDRQVVAEAEGRSCSPGCGLRLCEDCLSCYHRHQGDVVKLAEELSSTGCSVEAIRADAFMFGHVTRRLVVKGGRER